MTQPATLASGRSAFRLDGLTALVTGAGRGLGAQIATTMASEGARVFVLSRNASELDALAAQITASGGQAHPLVCDITDPDAVGAALEQIDRLDVLVNNAGTNMPAQFVDVSTAQLDAMLQLNVRSVFLTAQACTQKMIADGNSGGSIINISSQMGHVGAIRRSVYCMSKHAVEGLTKAMSLELAAHNIRVNTVAPTFVETPMTKTFFDDAAFRDWVMDRLPIGRLLQADEVAYAVCYLASPAAAMITGTSLKIDGGWTAQ